MTTLAWLNPFGAWWLLLIPALIAVYMLRARPERRVVSSLRLWRALPEIDRPKARLRRPPLSLLLLLQLLLLLAGAFALTRPALTAPAAGRTVILLDASGSMLADDGGASRFEHARSLANNLIDGIGASGQGTLVLVGPAVTTLCSNCSQPILRAALQKATPGAGRADWPSALEIASGIAAGAPGRTDTVVISDGAFDSLPSGSLPAYVHFVQVGRPADNRAITQISARKQPDGSPGYEAYARIDNYGSDTTVNVSSLADTVPQPSRQLQLPAGGHADLVWTLSAGTQKFTVTIDSNDALQADNQAVLFLPEQTHKVRIFSQQPALYSGVLSDLPGLEPLVGTEKGSDGGDTAFTLAEGKPQGALPSGSLLLVNPQVDFLPVDNSDLIDLRPVMTSTAHPLIQGIDLRAMFVLRAVQYNAPSWLEPVLNSDQGTLIYAGENNGQRVVVFAFDPSESNLTKLAAYPLLMQNVADWLYPLASLEALLPGESTRLGPNTQVKVPGGAMVQAGQNGQFADTNAVGIYQAGQGTNSTISFAVNMAGTGESDIAPRPHPELQREPATTAAAQVPGRELWPPLAAAALLLAGFEWLFYSWKRGRA